MALVVMEANNSHYDHTQKMTLLSERNATKSRRSIKVEFFTPMVHGFTDGKKKSGNSLKQQLISKLHNVGVNKACRLCTGRAVRGTAQWRQIIEELLKDRQIDRNYVPDWYCNIMCGYVLHQNIRAQSLCCAFKEVFRPLRVFFSFFPAHFVVFELHGKIKKTRCFSIIGDRNF